MARLAMTPKADPSVERRGIPRKPGAIELHTEAEGLARACKDVGSTGALLKFRAELQDVLDEELGGCVDDISAVTRAIKELK